MANNRFQRRHGDHQVTTGSDRCVAVITSSESCPSRRRRPLERRSTRPPAWRPVWRPEGVSNCGPASRPDALSGRSLAASGRPFPASLSAASLRNLSLTTGRARSAACESPCYGRPVAKPSEFIELVHLQIVCARLWEALPEGTTRIGREHLRLAAGAGRTFEEFVVTALDQFFDDAVARVPGSEETRARGGFSRELIRLGCMKFVTGTATRVMVQQRGGRVGRLPLWAVEHSRAPDLVQFETRGAARWYELSHDRLAEPVARLINREVSTLLFATGLLETVLNRARGDRGGRLDTLIRAGAVKDRTAVARVCSSPSSLYGSGGSRAATALLGTIRAGILAMGPGGRRVGSPGRAPVRGWWGSRVGRTTATTSLAPPTERLR